MGRTSKMPPSRGLLDMVADEGQMSRMTREPVRAMASDVPEYMNEVIPGNRKFGHTFEPEEPTDAGIIDAIKRAAQAGLISPQVFEILMQAGPMASQEDINDKVYEYATADEQASDPQIRQMQREMFAPQQPHTWNYYKQKMGVR